MTCIADYLPTRCPDLNPIESVFGKFMACLRNAPVRSIGKLWQDIANTLRTSSEQKWPEKIKHYSDTNSVMAQG